MSPHAEDFGQALAALRGPRPQAELARAARITPSSWSLYEKGRRLPREETMPRILAVLGCSQAELDEAIDRFRRERLLRQMAEAERAARLPDRGNSGAAGRAGIGLPEEARLEIRALTLRLARDLEELLMWVAKTGRS
ncbi:MAG TPA: helix-turn-helix transcriptional regulator [Thermoanaerobaculia bacterium]|nr:helix-turn-helix transcriptional regulator [Thermoanaerobaculia bacterium]